jgi:hypothetical protein
MPFGTCLHTGCDEAKSDWDPAQARAFVVTSVRAVHGLVMDMLSSAPNSASARMCRPIQWIPCYHQIDYSYDCC